MAQEHILETSLSTQSASTILFLLSILYITAGEKVLMKIWYSHGELLASQPAESPTNHYPNFLEHKEVFMTFHSNLSISSQYLESEYQMDLVSFLEVLQCSGPKADTLLLLLFFINARFYLVCVPLGAASVGI